jgi:hypothetical protein
LGLKRDLRDTQDIVVICFERKNGFFSSWSFPYKVVLMPEFDTKSRFENENHRVNPPAEGLTADADLLMEQILDNINTTPIGQVLRKIASLPEVRQEKVLDVRRQLTEGKYNLDERLDVALDKVLEYLTG